MQISTEAKHREIWQKKVTPALDKNMPFAMD